jgi:hypothetical protein
MAYLDFRQAFSTSSEPAPRVEESGAALSDAEVDTPPLQKRALATRLPRLHQSDRTTILFATFVFVGGLFCAFYFFNGGELLRAAAAWSREFLYPRPSVAFAENAKTDDLKPGSDSSQPSSAGARHPAEGNDTSPFSPGLGSLNPPTFSNAATAGSTPAGLPAGPGLLLEQLNVPPPGGDTLIQSFNQAVDNLARATTLFANSTATVVRTTVKQAVPKNAQLKSATQSASNVAGNLSAKQGAQASRTVNRQTQAATSTVQTVGRNLGQQGLGIQGLLGPGGLGDGILGLGGAAGMGGVGGGGGEGAVGGAMGAAGGIVGGLTGGH